MLLPPRSTSSSTKSGRALLARDQGGDRAKLEPERARSCRNALTMADLMVDEIRLRAHARPLDSDDQ